MINPNIIGTRISAADFGRRVRKDRQNYTYIFFKDDWKYAVPAHVKHQIIRSVSGIDIGIAISKNGCDDFRECDKEVVYGRPSSQACIYFFRTEDTVVVE